LKIATGHSPVTIDPAKYPVLEKTAIKIDYQNMASQLGFNLFRNNTFNTSGR
jgi:hypothetical protein